MDFEKYPRVIYERKRKPPSWVSIIILLIGLFFIIISLNFYAPSVVPEQARVLALSDKRIILFLGIDEMLDYGNRGDKKNLWKGRSDTIAIACCNPKTNSINILNIPRDTKVRINKTQLEKINFINAIGGPLLTKKCLQKLLGVYIDHYVVVNLNGLSKMIDSVGGVELDVPQKMQYIDRTAMLYIDLEPGKQLLNGKEAIQFVRFRHDSLGDIGRIQRQQIFMRAGIKKLMDPVVFSKLPSVISAYKETVLTDMKPGDIIKIANFARGVPHKNQNIAILPGNFGQRNSVSYWIPDKEKTLALVDNFFLDKKNSKKRVSPSRIKVCIFAASKNGNKEAKELSKILQKQGYNVISVFDYDETVKTSKIYAQNANSDLALQIMNDLGNFGELLVGNLGPPEADVTILAGDDLSKLKLKSKNN